MTVFYKRFNFWAYSIAMFLNMVALFTEPFQVNKVSLWLIVSLIVLLAYCSYDEIRDYPAKK